jgi:hypothetical protein
VRALIGGFILAALVTGCATPVYVCYATKDTDDTAVLVCGAYKGEK